MRLSTPLAIDEPRGYRRGPTGTKSPSTAPPGAAACEDPDVRIATWNINSVTARRERLLEWLVGREPDVLALQELKCATADFPFDDVAALGYEAAAHGDGRWNGVALLSRVGLSDVTRDLPGQPGFPELEPRAIGATCGGVRLWSLYVPNGREPGHAHYQYKLAWLEALAATARSEGGTGTPLALVGDFNVAPTDADVWDRAKFEGATHVTPAEREALAGVVAAGLTDLPPRALKGAPFTFWDYRGGAFHKGEGMRIDLVLANAPFSGRVKDVFIDRDARKGAGASDHAPVVVDLD